MSQPAPLAAFDPLIREWLGETLGEPTEVQALAWPRIAAGEHVLVSAPTGSGKTLTAFLWTLHQLLTGHWPPGKVRALYVSPLRALNNDIRRNLELPLEQLAERFRAAGREPPPLRAVTRSGDTPAAERRRMLRQPPEILITTPESLNILLTSKNGRRLLTAIETVILDEIHAVAGSKRGTHLITAVDRLVPLAGEFQRIALSATVRPMETVAELVGGYRLRDTEGGVGYQRRPVSLVRSTAAKTYDVKVRYPAAAGSELSDDGTWDLLVGDFRRVVQRNRSTLLFANSRRLTEKVTRLLNQDGADDLAYSHHGSLSREVRAVVEKRLKRGELQAIVATNSLELGIDIGALDEVVLIQTPRSIASAVQRVGRAGHGVGEVSRGALYPTHGRDFLDAAVVARAIGEQDIEDLKPIEAPLDVLAQVILSMVASEPWHVDALHAALRTSAPYHRLARRQLDLVLDMLAGRYADSRIRELRPRLSLDRVTGRLEARPGVDRLLYLSGGTIADRGYFSLRLEDTMAKIGELDEEFVWERSIGDSFTLGAQSWRIRRITHNDVLVAPTARGAALAPFWRADAQDRGFFLTQKAAAFLARAETRLEDAAFAQELRKDYRLEPAAAAELLAFLREQHAATGRLPRQGLVLVERCDDPKEGGAQDQLILHTLWGGTVNRPFAMALAAAWDERYPDPLEIHHDDDSLLLRLPRGVDAEEILSLVDPDHVEVLLRRRLEATGFFGARFRINASTALLLPRASFRQRTPLWMNRQRSKKLMESVASYGDFPVLVETWRTCLEDEFDLDNLKAMLRRLEAGELEVAEVRSQSPSPFARGLIWQHTNQLMYEDDTPTGRRGSGLRQDVLQELVFSSRLRPRLPRQLVERFRRKVQRTAAGYAPPPGEELRQWLRERLLTPEPEWRELLAAVEQDHGAAADEIAAGVAGRVLRITPPGAAVSSVCDLETVPRLLRALGLGAADLAPRGLEGGEPPSELMADLDALLALAADDTQDDVDIARSAALAGVVAEWLRFYGPCEPTRLAEVLGLTEDALRDVLEGLQEARTVVVDQLSRGGEALEVCDSENLEILLRWLRQEARPSFEALPAEALPLFLAHHQGLATPGDGLEDLQQRLETLFGWSAPAAAWESDLLPARLSPYYPSWLDSLMQESDLEWLGCGPGRLTFAFPTDRELFREPQETAPGLDPQRLFPERRGRYDLAELAQHSGESTARVSDRLWQLAWEGQVTNDSFLAVRKGIENKFQPVEPRKPQRSSRRHGFERWRTSRPSYGGWKLVEPEDASRDALELEELNKDRIRVLLARYGVLFRELLLRELPPLQWSRLFRTLRLMELSGEVLAGQFFQGVRGLQLISQAAFRELRRGLPEDAVWWLAAGDPASLCGVEIEGLKASLPARQATTYLVYHGRRPVLVAKRRGRELDPRVGPDHPHLESYLGVLKMLLTRDVQPLPSIDVETIAGEPAVASPYRAKLAEIFHVTAEPRALKLWKRY